MTTMNTSDNSELLEALARYGVISATDIYVVHAHDDKPERSMTRTEIVADILLDIEEPEIYTTRNWCDLLLILGYTFNLKN